jgi:hypothetical protein
MRVDRGLDARRIECLVGLGGVAAGDRHAHFRAGLSRHAITAHAGRNSAVGALAAELPAPVLAGITGLNITTATSWTRSTSRDWTQYLAARTQGP